MSGPWMKLVVAASALWCVIGLGILLSWGFFRDFDPPTSFAVVASIAVILGLARLLIGRRHQRQLVFWCRRFGDTDTLAGELNRWHGRMIDEAAKDLALPVTLQDESVATPPLVANAVVFPVFVIMAVGSLGTTLAVLDLPWFDTRLGQVASFVVSVLALTAASIVAVMAARWLGTRRVAPGTVTHAAQRAMRRKRSRAGLLVLQCKSIDWQKCVAELFDSATLAIIDMSVLSGSTLR